MTEGVAFLLERIKDIDDKKRKMKEVFDGKEWEDNYMTRVVGGPLGVFVGKWNDTRSQADQIGRVGIEPNETLEHFEKRFSDSKPKRYGFFALGGEVSDEVLDKAKEYNLTYETVRGNYFFKGTSKDLVAFVREELGGEGTEEDLINQADKEFSRVRTVDKLIQSASKEAFEKNLKTELEAGKSKEQALAIAYATQRKNAKDSSLFGVSFEGNADDVYIYEDKFASSMLDKKCLILVDFTGCEYCFQWAKDEDGNEFITDFDKDECLKKASCNITVGGDPVDKFQYAEMTKRSKEDVVDLVNDAIKFAMDEYYNDIKEYGSRDGYYDSVDKVNEKLIDKLVSCKTCDSKDEAKDLVECMSKETKIKFLKNFFGDSANTRVEEKITRFIEKLLAKSKYIKLDGRIGGKIKCYFDPSLIEQARDSMKDVLKNIRLEISVDEYDKDDISVSIIANYEQWCSDLELDNAKDLESVEKYIEENLGDEVLLDNAKNNDTFENKA